MVNTHRTVGHGPHHVIALHGWFGSADGWGPFYEVLDQNAFTYVFMDYRGYGRSRSVEGSYTLAEIASDTLALADELGWERFSIVGHSMGGKAMQQVLLDSPKRIEKLVGITPVPATTSPFDEQRWNLFSRSASDLALRKNIIDVSTGRRLSAYWLDKMVEHSAQNSTIAAFSSYLTAWAKTDVSIPLDRNSVAIKIIVGAHDPSLTIETMRHTYMRSFPNAILECMANAGHYPMEETPVALATSIESFLHEA